MKLLLKQVIISDINSPHNGQQKDILINDGIITSIAEKIDDDNTTLVQHAALNASPGWVDIFSHFCDTGFENRETIATGSAAAATGGFTNVFIVPNTVPVIANKAQVEYVLQQSKQTPVNVIPLGAVTKNAEGKELAEMYDMLYSGAVAFSDGWKPVQNSGLLLKALQYVKAFNGVIIQLPVDKSIASLGLMNEGITSTLVGLAGIPDIAEELIVSRDIELAKYTNSKLHITGITTAKSVELISKAKAEGVAVTCSVTPYHLFFCDEDLTDYNTNLKVDPPLRSKQNMLALQQAVHDGKIDCIASHHLPQDWDNKVCEFEYAGYGMSGLESCFMVFNTIFPNLPTEQMVKLFSLNARAIFGLPPATIAEDAKADITLFERDTAVTFSTGNIKSKSINNAFINSALKGKVVGIINKDQLYLNQLK